MSISPKKTDRAKWRMASFAGAALCLAAAEFAVADEPPVRLLPPQAVQANVEAAVILRASAEEIVPIDPPPPVVKERERPPDFKFPAPYTREQNRLFDFSALRRRSNNADRAEPTDDAPKKETPKQEAAKIEAPKQESPRAEPIRQVTKIEEPIKKEEKKPEPAQPEREKMSLARGLFYRQKAAATEPINQVAVGPSTMAPAPINLVAAGPGPSPVPMPRPEVPAWRWFGYGAPVPGRNPYAPDGVYGTVNPLYYYQNGATPGAIPQPLTPPVMRHASATPVVPQLPQPTLIAPPATMSLPFPPPPAPLAPETPMVKPEAPPATIEPPIAPAQTMSSESWKPLTDDLPPPIIRSQAPEEPTVPEKLLSALRKECAGHTTKIELLPKGPGQIRMRLTLAPGALADRLADRIARLPELAGYTIELEFTR